MEPFYFGEAGKELFGLYHPPGKGSGDVAAVICPPLFGEYLRSYGALRRLALDMAAQGCHVLRFDYFGTGDSAGEFQETTTDDWLASIAAAAAELKAVSGIDQLRLVGVRFGATLAALASQRIAAVQSLSLWDPIVDGADYVDQLRETHRRLLRLHPDTSVFAERPPDGAETELAGFPVSIPLLSSIAGARFPQWSKLADSGCRGGLLVLGDEDFGYAPLVSDAQSHGVEVRKIAFSCNWTTHSEAVLFPHEIVSALAELK